jgi:hypothetical protein
MKSLIIFLLICYNLCSPFDEIDNKINLYFLSEIKIKTSTPDLSLQLSDFLNGIFDTNLGLTILKKCSIPYNPDVNSHNAFIAQYLKSSSSAENIVKKKLFKQINGKTCEYNLSDPNIFVSAKKADISTQSLFSALFTKTSFGKGFLAFSNCIGKNQLYEIADPYLVDQIFLLLGNEKMIPKLFHSFCSVNNIFSQIVNQVDPNAVDVFSLMGTQLNKVMKSVQPHYQALIK